MQDVQKRCADFEPKMLELMNENDRLLSIVRTTATDIQVLQEKYVELQKPIQPLIGNVVPGRPNIEIREEFIERPVIVEVPVEMTIEQPIEVPVDRIIEQPVYYEEMVQREVPVERDVYIEEIVERPIIREIVIENVIETPVPKYFVIEEPVPTPVERPVVVEIVRTVHEEIFVDNGFSPQIQQQMPSIHMSPGQMGQMSQMGRSPSRISPHRISPGHPGYPHPHPSVLYPPPGMGYPL